MGKAPPYVPNVRMAPDVQHGEGWAGPQLLCMCACMAQIRTYMPSQNIIEGFPHYILTPP